LDTHGSKPTTRVPIERLVTYHGKNTFLTSLKTLPDYAYLSLKILVSGNQRSTCHNVFVLLYQICLVNFNKIGEGWVNNTFHYVSNLNERIIKTGIELMILKELIVEYSKVTYGHSSGMADNKHEAVSYYIR
jgi:hypothetical protein